MSEPNPYQASETPSTGVPAGSTPGQPPADAPLVPRLAAAMIDGMLQFAFVLPGMLFIGWSNIGKGDVATIAMHQLFFLACCLPYFLINGYLVGLTGQTLGKKLLGLQIRKLDGTLPSAFEWFYKRSLPVLALSYLPVVGGWIALADALLIFGAKQRCGHDWIAGTRVVKL
ncbi:MAG: RDD family protein [Fibrobacteres bacterium]|nr:RDD family protein [Fibrobacterota bacterium]